MGRTPYRRWMLLLSLVALVLGAAAVAHGAAPPAGTATPTRVASDASDEIAPAGPTPVAPTPSSTGPPDEAENDVDQVGQDGITPTAEADAAPGPSDADRDGVPNPVDNCPLSPDAGQADSDGNGVGDVCDVPFAGGFAFRTPDGVVQLRTDDRLRPAQIVAPAAQVTFVWSDDAIWLTLIAQADGHYSSTTMEIDLSDAAVMVAIDAVEAESGNAMAALRSWLRDNPGRVLAVASGEQLPTAPENAGASSSRVLHVRARVLPPLDELPHVRRYLDNLILASDNVIVAYHQYQLAHPELTLAASLTRNVLYDTMITVTSFVDRELRNCNPCSPRCHIDCGAGEGACFTDHPNASPCYENLEQDCAAFGGVFYLGQTCPFACWLFSDGWSDCEMLTREDCMAIPGRSKASGGLGNITTRFCDGHRCSAPVCSP